MSVTSLVPSANRISANGDERNDTSLLEQHSDTTMFNKSDRPNLSPIQNCIQGSRSTELLHPINVSRKQTKEPPNFTKSYGEISPRQTSTKLFDCMKKPAVWGKKAMDDGCIYVLQIRGEPNYVKIGRTAKDVDKRRTQHLGCGYDLDVVDDSCYTKIPCHQRLERLIHLELQSVRHHFSCSCKTQKDNPLSDTHVNDGLTTHGEWFEIEYQQALKVVKKWRDWMAKKPYGETAFLKAEWTERIQVLDSNSDYTQILEKEGEKGELMKSLLYTPSTGCAWIDRGLLAARYDAKGILLSNRWENIKSYSSELFVFCVLQYMITLALGEHWYVRGLLSLMTLYWL